MSIAIRPTGGFAAWASGISGAARIVEPTQTEKNLGWQTGQVPPSSYHNWLSNLSYGWQAHLDDRTRPTAIRIRDEFLSPTFAHPLFYNNVDGGVSMGADPDALTASGAAFGMMTIRAPVSVGAGVRGTNHPFGAKDVLAEARVKVPTLGISAVAYCYFTGDYLGFKAIGYSGVSALGASGQLMWQSLRGSQATLTGVRVNPSGWQRLEARRINNLAQFFIDGVEVPGAGVLAASANGAIAQLGADGAASGTAHLQFDYSDYLIDR